MLLFNRTRLPVLAVLVLAVGIGMWLPRDASADRLGPPWLARVVVDRATVHSRPDRASALVGPLAHDALVVVIGEQGDWTQLTTGWVQSASIEEWTTPWVGEVMDGPAPVYAKPNPGSGARRSGQTGDLLRVMGVASGVDGDSGLWWSTTEGFVALSHVRPTTGKWAASWSVPAAADALRGWWGAATGGKVRAGPTTDAPEVGTFGGGEIVRVIEELPGAEVGGSSTWYRIDGGRYAGAYVHSSVLGKVAQPTPVVVPPPVEVGSSPWIVVDRASHTLTLLQSGAARLTTYVSLGKAGRDTPVGDYSTWGKHRAERMTSRANSTATGSYDLPNVPFVEYYKDSGYAIHGTYWHDVFGSDESQGCVNLTWSDAAYLFEQTRPPVLDGKLDRWWAASADQATPVVIL